jgi:hypothetical protein
MGLQLFGESGRILVNIKIKALVTEIQASLKPF